MIFEIIYHEAVIKEDISKLDNTTKHRIKTNIEKKLLSRPEVFGKPLRRSIKGYRKLRVGDYRVIFRIQEKQVKIFAIQHRSEVYKNAKKRI
jgi:mRNA interferase RelE/StbE